MVKMERERKRGKSRTKKGRIDRFDYVKYGGKKWKTVGMYGMAQE